MTPSGQLGSKNYSPFESTYMTSYPISNDTCSLSRTVFEIFDFLGLTLIFDPQESPEVKNFFAVWKPEVKNFFAVRKPIHELSRYFLPFLYRFCDIWLELFEVRQSPLTPRGHLKSKNVFIRNPSMTSYLTPIDIISLSHKSFEIIDIKEIQKKNPRLSGVQKGLSITIRDAMKAYDGGSGVPLGSEAKLIHE